jgi:hypothetical protein
VADQPLSVTVPFSGTVRPTAGTNGRTVSWRLLCAYGEGAEPAAELHLAWREDGSGACHEIETVVAPELDAAPFERVAGDLASDLGPSCPPPDGTTPVVPLVVGGLAAFAGGLLLRRRRRGRRAAREPAQSA